MEQEIVVRDILEYITEHGPTLPMEIASLLKKDSFISNAFLSDMIAKGHIKKTIRTYGDSPLYFIDGQEDAVRTKLLEVLKENEKKLVEKFQRDKVFFEHELEPQERFILRKLSDYIFQNIIQVRDQTFTCYRIHNLKDEFFNQIVKEKVDLMFPKEEKPPEIKEKPVQTKIETPKVEEKKHATIEIKPKTPIKIDHQDTLQTDVKIEGELEEKAGEVIKGLQGRILDKKVVKKNSEIDFKTKISGMMYIVKAKKKANLNESDLSLMYTQVVEEKRPMLLITNARISKKAKAFKDKRIGDLIRILNI